MASHATYLWPGVTRVGFGAAGFTGEAVKIYQARHAFVLADPGVVTAGLLEPVSRSLNVAGVAYTVYDRIVPNPSVVSVDAAAAAYRESGAEVIVAVGGGSGIDTGKGVRLLAGGPAGASIAEYALILGDKARPVPHPRDLPPMIALPTTAGTGAEVTPWAVITDEARQLKFGIGGAYLLPGTALVDPELTLTLPPGLTAATGIDALSHCIEAYVSTNHNPLLDRLILQGIELIGRSLRVAVAQGSNRPARRDMMEGALLGGIAISSNWLGACHALAHQLSSFANLHHGLAIALMLPPQMAYSLPGALERYAQIGAALDAPRPVSGTLRRRAERAVEAVYELIGDIGLPTSLQAAGISEDLIPAMAKSAYANDLNWTTNPRQVDEETLAMLYRQVL